MLVGTLGTIAAQAEMGSTSSASPAGEVPVVLASDSTVVNITSFTPQSTLPAPFWGTTDIAASPTDANSSLEVNATSAREIIFPGGYLADQMDLINGTITGNKGGVSQAQTTTAEFVQWCESIGCHAIMEVPGEINSSSTAAAYVGYVEQTLHFHPDYWEIGNEPAIWKKYDLPWSEWATHNSTAPTPAQYALLVHRYIAAMRTVDPNIPIMGMPGTGTGTYGETNWLSATVSENGPNLSAVSIHVYPGGPGPTNPANVTLTEFLTTLRSHASLPVRVPLDIAAIQAACPSCGPIPLLVTEFGSAISGKLQDAYIEGFPQVVYIGSELIQAAHLPLTDMAYWSLEHNNPSAWFPIGGTSRPVYQLYAEILSRFGPNVLNTSVTSTVPGVYALATLGTSSTSPIDLLVINSNATQPISFSTGATGLNVSGPLETWTWNSSSSEPVTHYWATGLPATWQEPAASLVLFEQPRTPTFPLTVTESGLPSGTRWFLQVGNVSETTNTTHLTFFLPNGQYDQSFLQTEYPANGERITLALPPTITIDNAPVSESGTYGLQYLVTTSASPGSGGTTSPASEWVSSGSSTTIRATAASGYQFTGWQGSGSGSYSGTANPTTLTPSGPVTEVAEFSPSSEALYPVTFTESGLPTGTTWWVNLTGEPPLSTTGASVGTSLANGSYPYSVASANKSYSSTGGDVTVNGASVSVSVTFSQVTYGVTFTESGLPAGTEWWVNLTGGSSLRATGTSVSASLANGTYSYGVASANRTYSSPGGTVVVQGSPVSVSIAFALVTYSVTLTESGLPAGAEWWTNLSNGQTFRAGGTTLTFHEPNGSYGYTVATSVPAYAAAGGTFTVDGGPLSRNVSFVLGTYLVTFAQSGLPSGTQWWANVSGQLSQASTYSEISLNLPNGSYTYGIASANKGYSAPGGSFTVDGKALTEPVRFAPVTFAVTFAESGLPTGQEWWVNLTDGESFSGTQTTLSFPEPNGTYAYRASSAGWAAAPPSGTFRVEGAPVRESISFGQALFTVTLAQSGLPPGTVWSAVVDGLTHSSRGSTIGFAVEVGTYPYAVDSIGNWVPSPGRGNVTISETDTTVSVTFSFTYALTVHRPGGISDGTSWSVTLGGTAIPSAALGPAGAITRSATGPTIVFYEPNGTYSYSAAVAGHPSYRATGFTTLSGAPASVTLHPLSGSSTFGLGPIGYLGVGAVITALVIAVVAAVVRRRRRREPPRPPE